MKINKKEVYSFTSSLLIIIVGVILLCFGNKEVDTTVLYAGIMFFYAILKLTEYFLTKEKGDYENLFIAFASIITSSIIFTLLARDIKTPMLVPVSLISWVAMLAILKLIKVDFLMDRKNKMWYVELIILILFVIIGILTSINLYHINEIQNMVLGFFFLLLGILEFLYPLVNTFFKRAK